MCICWSIKLVVDGGPAGDGGDGGADDVGGDFGCGMMVAVVRWVGMVVGGSSEWGARVWVH